MIANRLLRLMTIFMLCLASWLLAADSPGIQTRNFDGVRPTPTMVLPAPLDGASPGASDLPVQRQQVLKPRWVRPKPEHSAAASGVYPEAVVVKFTQPSRIRLREGILVDLDANVGLTSLYSLLSLSKGIVIRRHFSAPEEALEAKKQKGEANSGQELGDLNLYYLFDLRGAPGLDPEAFVDQLNRMPFVEIAFFLPIFEPALLSDEKQEFPMTPVDAETSWLFTPGNYESGQVYIDPAPTGIDAEWAWTLNGGRGSQVKVIDFEVAWNYFHSDLRLPFVILPSGYSPPSPSCTDGHCDYNKFRNHGTAVLGVMVSLNNGVGTTGIISDAQYGVCSEQDYEDPWPHVADGINAAFAQLSSGDILLYELHAQGPASGKPATCAGEQFEYIAIEYWQDNFDATQTATANYVVVVEAAGNGEMDLDDPVYGGAFNRYVRDSGAIIVGAGTQWGHSPHCYSNYGSRVDVQGAGDSVLTIGYGTYYPGTDLCSDVSTCNGWINQLYTNSFSGTSSASPIVAGAAGVIQSVSKANYSLLITPLRMRNLLQVNATPQTAPLDRHIGPLPNLRGCIRADLKPDVPQAGWFSCFVPRNANDAAPGNVTLPATLSGNTATTYLNVYAQNVGIYESVPARLGFFLDESWLGYATFSWIQPDYVQSFINHTVGTGSPLTVRGGRHTLRAVWDELDVVPELDELNNECAWQYVWSPYALTNEVPVTRGPPPDRDTPGAFDYNSDGFGFQLGAGTAWWGGVGILPTAVGENYDIRIHDDYAGSQTGFSTSLGWSNSGAGLSDFVLANGNYVGGTATRWAGVIQANSDPDSQNYVIEYSNGDFLDGPGSYGHYDLAANHILAVFEVRFLAEHVGRYFDFILTNSGSADLGFSLYDAGLAYATKSQHLPGALGNSGGPGSGEGFTMAIPAAGYYALVVWKADSADLPLSSTFDIEIALTPPNLQPHKPSSWSFPLVPRDSAGCTSTNCDLTFSLPGNAGPLYLNLQGINNGINSFAGAFRTAFLLDGTLIGWRDFDGTFPVGGTFYDLNNDWFTVRGGRHTLAMAIDDQDLIPETSEADNGYTRQFVFSPLLLSPGAPQTRGAPPDRDSLGYGGLYYNCDGFSFLTSWWSAVGLVPGNYSDNYDLRLHNDYFDSQTGFADPIATSSEGPGLTDFVLVNGNRAGTGIPFYAAAIQAADAPAAGDFIIEERNSEGSISPTGTFTLSPIDAGHLLGVVDLSISALDAGKTYAFTLQNSSGTADLGFGLYSKAESYFAKNSALILSNSAGGGGAEHFMYTFPTPGLMGDHYGLVVWKSGTGDLAIPSPYKIRIQAVQPAFVPDGTTLRPGTPLRIVKNAEAGKLDLTWGAECNQKSDSDYAIYLGDLDYLVTTGNFSYGLVAPICNAGKDLMETINAPAGNTFILVVPHDLESEGSYGRMSTGVERPGAGPGWECRPRVIDIPCVL